MKHGYTTLMRFQNTEEAEYYKEILEDRGIFAVVTDERAVHPGFDDEFNQPPRLAGWIRLQIPEEDAIRAGQILAEDFDAVERNSSLF